MAVDVLVIMFMSGPDDGRVVRLVRSKGHGTVHADESWALLFGRREDCDVIIPFDTQVSRRHAALRVTEEGELWLNDISSLNGTFVGKERITDPVQIRWQQLFRLGRTWLRVQAEVGD
jgi:pSer/pThr/pTyr-binding forkhead associated (FHA) protein